MFDIVGCEAPSTAHEQKAQKQLFRNSPKAKFCSNGFSRHELYLSFASSERVAGRHNCDDVLPMSVSSCRAARGRVMLGLHGRLRYSHGSFTLWRCTVTSPVFLLASALQSGDRNERPHALQTTLRPKLRRVSSRYRGHVVRTQHR